MSAYLSSVAGAGLQAFNNTGAVLAGGLLYTYSAGSTAAAPTWTDSTQSVLNANPIVLSSAGRITNEIWLQGGQLYKLVLKDANNVTLATWDNIPGINDANYAGFSEWVAYGSAPTYVSGTSFTVSGNATATLQVGRRIQFFLLGGTYYGTVLTSTYNSGPGTTTIVLTLDSTAMDATLYAFSYGFMSAVNSSIPIGIYAPVISPVFSGNPTVPTAAGGDASLLIANTSWVDTWFAKKASPTFTGIVSVPLVPTTPASAASKQYADAASATAGQWAPSPQTYLSGTVVFSPTNFASYRNKTGVNTTSDPITDSTNWSPANPPDPFGILAYIGY